MPAAMLLVLWWRMKPISRQRIFQIVPFFLLGLGMGLITLWWERYHVGTRGALFALGPLERLLVATRAIWFYLGKIFWPSNLTFIYPQWKIVGSDPLAYAWLLAGFGLCGAIYFARRVAGRSIEVAALFFVATLSPLLGFIMLYTFRYTYVADHYQYLASIGPIALASAGLAWVGEFLKHGRQIIRAAGILIIVSLGVLTWRQSATYSDVETLWRTTLAKNPDCWMAYNNLGIALSDKGEIDEAISQYQKSLQFHSDYEQAHYNLGRAFFEKGNIDEAIAQCQEALALQPKDADAHVVLGNALLAKGLMDEAIGEYLKALEFRPDHSNAYYNLGNVLLKKGEVAAAVAQFEEALKLQPDMLEAHLQLGDVFLEKGNWREAIIHYEQAAAAYAKNRQFDKAIETAQRALQWALREDPAQAQHLQRELDLYQKGSPSQTR